MDHLDNELNALIAKAKTQGYLTYDEVNDYLRHGLRIVRLEPAEIFRDGLDEANPEKGESMISCFTVILDDYGNGSTLTCFNRKLELRVSFSGEGGNEHR